MIRKMALSPLSYFGKKKYRHLIIRTFLFFHRLIEITLFAFIIFGGKRTLHLPSAQRTCDNPARPPGIIATMNAIQAFLAGDRADTEIFFVLSPLCPTAFLGIPTVPFLQYSLPPFLK
jgi:hypothetical protein